MFFEAIKMAFVSIWTNKARAVLTMLGVIIGVGAVVGLIGIGQGVKSDVGRMVTDLGSNILIVVPGKVNPEDLQGGGFSPESMLGGNVLTKNDVKAVKKIPQVEKVAPLSILSGIIKYNNITASNALFIATDLDIEGATNFEIDQGRFFSQADIDGKAKVTVLGNKVYQQLFNGSLGIGQNIFINGQPFEVVGNLKKLSSTDVFGGGNIFDSVVTIPIPTAEAMTDSEAPIQRIIVKVNDQYNIKDILPKVEEKILAVHNGSEDFTVLTQEDVLSLFDKILNILTTLVTAIAAISLVVGGIGIMNIMLVSVTERTREIGLRKAVGATSAAILWQFLIEAIVVALFGGAIGVALAYGGAEILKQKTVLKPEISLWSIILAVGVSVVVGVVFGMAPAIRAARKDPIEALRYE